MKDVFLIGVMSGTSLDALDAVLIAFNPQKKSIRVVEHESLPLSLEIRRAIYQACDPERSSVVLLSDLNVLHARLTAKLVLTLLKKSRVAKKKILAVGYHGQTVWHRTQSVRLNGEDFLSTLQIGDGPTLAALSGLTVINNFRTKDQAFGGQGAPLVPFAHRILFADNLRTLVVNLGGVMNLTSLIPRYELGFDLGPCNLLLNSLAENLLQQEYDLNGEVAAKGQASEEIIQAFLADDFFSKNPPKSTGRERYGADYAEQFYKFCREAGLGVSDIFATATLFVARNLVRQAHFFLPENKIDRVILCGGGACNAELVRQIQKSFLSIKESIAVMTSSDCGFHPQHIECISFALLAYYSFYSQPNCLGKLTGSMKNLSLGQISWP